MNARSLFDTLPVFTVAKATVGQKLFDVKVTLQQGFCPLNIELEEENIAVLDNVFLSFLTVFSCSLDCGF